MIRHACFNPPQGKQTQRLCEPPRDRPERPDSSSLGMIGDPLCRRRSSASLHQLGHATSPSAFTLHFVNHRVAPRVPDKKALVISYSTSSTICNTPRTIHPSTYLSMYPSIHPHT